MNGIIFVGLQASGKSNFYQANFSNTHLRLNLDMLKTRHRESILFDACLRSKQPVVIDNTNPKKVDREKYIQGFRRHGFAVAGYYFASDLNACLERNAGREGNERIPNVGVLATYKKLELPEYSEGFDQLYYVILENGMFKVEECKDEIR